MLQAVNAESLSLAKIKLASPESAKLILEALISEVVLFFNVGKTMSEHQIKATADLMLSDMQAKNMKPEDYRVMFDNAKRGMYGKQYDRLDGQVIFEWINTYWDERSSLIEQMHIDQHNKTMSQQFDKSEVNPEGQARVIKEIKDALTFIDPEPPALQTLDTQDPAPRVIDEKNAFIQKCFEDFDKEYRLRGLKGPVRCITYGGRPVDQVEFTELKLKEANL